MSRVAVKPRLLKALIREELARNTEPRRVDREAGIIYGVKVVGLHSPNAHGIRGPNGQLVEGTDYLPEALKKALPLYEGRNVNVDHPPRGQAKMVRSPYDRFAWLEKVEVIEEGAFGELHFLDPGDPLAVRMFNAAEKKPDAFALSHNASAVGDVQGNRYVVSQVYEVRSVDIVSEGGTNASLFEGREMAARTLRTILQESKGIKSPVVKLRQVLLEMGKTCVPEDMMDAEMPEAYPEDEGDWKQSLVDAISKLVSSGDEADHKMAQKIMGMLKPETAVEEDDEEETETEESEEEESDDKEPKDKAVKESRELRREVKQLKDELAITSLCESLEFRPSATQKKALKALKTEADRKALIQESKATSRSSTPRNSGYAGNRPAASGVAATKEDRLKQLTSGR